MSRDAVERIRRGYEAFNRGHRTETLEAAGVSE